MRRMSSQDAAFLYGETDAWHMHVASLVILDPATSEGRFSFERVRDLTMERLPQLPQFRWQLVDVPFGVDLPGWIEGSPIDVDYHFKSVWLPDPGTNLELTELVSELVANKLDRSRPLWEVYVIGGLAGGKAAVLTKVHHALIDGVSGAEVSEVMMDLAVEPRSAPTEVLHGIDSERPGNPQLFARGLVKTALRTPVRLARFAAQSVQQGIAASGSLLGSQRPALPYTAPQTHLTGEFTARRKLGMVTIELDRVKRVRAAFGITMNDVVLGLCAGALREYLLDRDDLPAHGLVVQCPVSMRQVDDRGSVGSKVGSIFVDLATNIDDPADRLQAIAKSASQGKRMHKTLEEHHHSGVTETAPPGLVGLAARLYTSMHLSRMQPAVNLVISNVPGPQLPLFMAGAQVEGLFPMGPLLLGMGLNITVFSLDGCLHVGVFSCPDLVDDPQQIADGILRALDELEEMMVSV